MSTIAPLVGAAKELLDCAREETTQMNWQDCHVLPRKENVEICNKLQKVFIDFIPKSQRDLMPPRFLLNRASLMLMILLNERMEMVNTPSHGLK